MKNSFNYAFYGALFFLLSVLLQYFWIKIQRRESFTQAQKSYGVNIDVEIKAATPSMGGVVFLVLAFFALILNLFMGFSANAFIFWSLPIAGGIIGFIDDGLKFFSHSSEGFKSLGKLKVQLVICALWVLALFFTDKLDFWPELFKNFSNNFLLNFLLKILILVSAFLGSAGMLNAVNITDGLDGLAGGCFLISLAVTPIVLPLSEFNIINIIILFFIVSGFMFFNIRPARTFMGDTGAHFLGGALAALCIMNGRILALIPVGFLFIIEMLSSAIQIFTIRKLNKRVFLMAPLHHHFQLKLKNKNKIIKENKEKIENNGEIESRVTMFFWLIHAVGALFFALILNAL